MGSQVSFVKFEEGDIRLFFRDCVPVRLTARTKSEENEDIWSFEDLTTGAAHGWYVESCFSLWKLSEMDVIAWMSM